MLGFFSAPAKTVAGAALVLAIFAVLSRLLGLFRDRLLASTFGAGDTLDIYYASFRVPDFLYSLLILGAISAAFIPIITEVFEKESSRKAWKITSDLLFVVGSAIITLSILGAIFMPYLAALIAPGFTGEKKELFIELSRIMFLSPVFLGLSAVFGGILVSRRCFFAYSIAPILYNCGIILGVLFFVPKFGIAGLAWGVVSGAAAHCLAQFIFAKRQGWTLVIPGADIFKDPYNRRIGRLMVPQTLSMATNQLNFFVITIFASFLATGSIAVYNFANNLQSIALGLFGVSFGIAVFPKLSTQAARKEWGDFSRTVQKTALRVLYFVVPISIFLIILRAQIVRVVLGSGDFGWQDTEMTFQVLAILSASLFAQSLLPLLSRSFYSFQDTSTPLIISLMSQIVNITLALFLYKPFGIYGLAAAFSAASIFNAMALSISLFRRLDRIRETPILADFGKICAAAMFAGIAAQLAKTVVGSFVDLNTFAEVFLQLTLSLLLGVCVYLIASYVFRIEEFFDFRKQIYTRMFRKSPMGDALGKNNLADM